MHEFQTDLRVRRLGDEKMIGPSILVPTAAREGVISRSVYLPAGEWIDYRTDLLQRSRGEDVELSFQRDGHFELPYLVRRGAILPILWVDAQTMNIAGRRLDGVTITDLNLRAYPATEPSTFDVFEDDGETIAYRTAGAFVRTRVETRLHENSVELSVAPSEGSYAGAPTQRRIVPRVVVPGREPARVTEDGVELRAFTDKMAFEKADSGWFWDGRAMTLVRTSARPVAAGTRLFLELKR